MDDSRSTDIVNGMNISKYIALAIFGGLAAAALVASFVLTRAPGPDLRSDPVTVSVAPEESGAPAGPVQAPVRGADVDDDDDWADDRDDDRDDVNHRDDDRDGIDDRDDDRDDLDDDRDDQDGPDDRDDNDDRDDLDVDDD